MHNLSTDSSPILCINGFCYGLILQPLYLLQVLGEELRILNRSFIAVFMILLFVPLVFVDLSTDRVSIQENRMLAQPPSLSDIKNHPGFFISQFDAWFKDSTGFREQLVSLYNAIYKNNSLTGEVHFTDGQYTYLIGEQGHHYFADVNGKLIPKFQGKQFLSEEQLENMAARLEDVKTYLDNKGIPLAVMFCTDKESIYPEFYPKSVNRGPEPIQLEVITSYLQDHTSVEVFNIRQALLAQKNDYLLYAISSGDLTHYNEIGAFFAYRELMKHINIHFPQIIPYELDDVEISYDEKENPQVSLRMEKNYKNLDAPFFNGLNLNESTRAYDIAYENIETDLPIILLLRDSYAHEQYIGKYLAQHFGKTIFIHYVNSSHIKEYIDRFNPDIVVFESAERALNLFANLVAEIPEL
jgi:hypothetical protein